MSAAQILADHGYTTTHWGLRIIKADQLCGCDGGDRMAGEEWPTCACGVQDPRLMSPAGTPKDQELINLGFDFSDMVNTNEFELAAMYLIQIELRAAELVRNLS